MIPGTSLNSARKDGSTALIWAAFYGHTETARLPIEKGADLNTADKYGNTALIWAACHGHTKTAQLLIEKGADPKAANVDTSTRPSAEADGAPLSAIRAALKLG